MMGGSERLKNERGRERERQGLDEASVWMCRVWNRSNWSSYKDVWSVKTGAGDTEGVSHVEDRPKLKKDLI